MLEAEMDEHLGFEKHNVPGKSSSQQMPLFRAEDQP